MAEERRLTAGAWREARALVWRYRYRLTLGLLLMLVSRGAGFVLPAMTRYVIDDVIPNGRADELLLLAGVALGATVVQAATSFSLSQLLGVAAQRAITEVRKQVMAHVTRLPIRYFDATRTGVLISRIMTDAEGIREPGGDRARAARRRRGHERAGARLAVLPQLAAHQPDAGGPGRLRRLHVVYLLPAAADLPGARQDQRRGHGTARRDPGRHPSSQGIHRREARADRLCARGAPPVPQRGEVGDRRVRGLFGGHPGDGDHRRADDRARRAGADGRLLDGRGAGAVPRLHRPGDRAHRADLVDWHADHRGVRRPRPHPRDPGYADRGRGGRGARGGGRDGRGRAARARLVRVRQGRAGAPRRVAERSAGHHHRAGRLERVGQEHADQPGAGVQPAHVGTRAGGRPRRRVGPPPGLPLLRRRRAAGQLPVRRHDRGQHQLLEAGRPRPTRSAR